MKIVSANFYSLVHNNGNPSNGLTWQMPWNTKVFLCSQPHCSLIKIASFPSVALVERMLTLRVI
jgi:hypothetical protein